MRLSSIILAAALLGNAVSSTHAAESVFPVGSGITAVYTLSATDRQEGDTITITRRLTNNAAFPLTGLYLSEHLPAGARLVASAATVDGSPVTVSPTILPLGAIVDNCFSYYWEISPAGETAVPAGQTLQLELKVIFPAAGQYTLPLHTAAFFGAGNPFFAVGDQFTVDITDAADTTPPAAIGDLRAE